MYGTTCRYTKNNQEDFATLGIWPRDLLHNGFHDGRMKILNLDQHCIYKYPGSQIMISTF